MYETLAREIMMIVVSELSTINLTTYLIALHIDPASTNDIKMSFNKHTGTIRCG
jgi:hypothetical protein